MSRKCSEIFMAGDILYIDTVTSDNKIRVARIVTKNGKICRFTYRLRDDFKIEVIYDEYVQ